MHRGGERLGADNRARGLARDENSGQSMISNSPNEILIEVSRLSLLSSSAHSQKKTD